ncbi:CENP-C_C domain-containing protein [Trichonephila inaurata madagascariensis]|uniref:CENP-C_C domain-containing protein n=1 Tax=Trichonephila inaurata madagascariensis TaxID=2747483 RepID=A0A8X6XWI8_9ARAC|nr:CENP-C_C domain-containing protein [Trichonephila inaurata madagascariensis]
MKICAFVLKKQKKEVRQIQVMVLSGQEVLTPDFLRAITEKRSSGSFSGSVKEIKRVVQKSQDLPRPPRPLQVPKLTKEKSQSQTGTGRFISKFWKRKAPSKPELLTKRKFAFPKYLPRQGKSYDGSSVKRPRAAVENFESGKSSSNPEFSPVLRGICPEASIGIVQEQPASKPEHSRVIKGRSKIPILASGQEQPPSKPERSPVTKGRPRTPKEGSIQEKSPTMPGHSPVTRGRSTISIEAPSKPEHSRVTRGRSRISVYNLRPLNSSSVPEESSKKRKRPRETTEHFEPEESASEPEQSPVKKRTKIPSAAFDQKKSATKITPFRSGNNNEEGPLRKKPSVTKRHVDSSVKMSQKHSCQTRSNVQVEYDSPRTSPVKRKSRIATYDIIHQNQLGPEASVIESETSPKKITQVTGEELNHSGQKNISAKAKAPTNKKAAPVDNKEDQSVRGENSEPANGLRRSSRFRVPPLATWRNERLVFETLPSGEVKCRVDKGSEEDKFGLIQIAKKAERRIQMAKKKARTVKNTPIVDTRTGETVHALLHRPFESLHWSSPPSEVERPSPYNMVKAFKSDSTSFGFLKISPLSSKETQYSPLYNLHFVLMKGHLKVVIQNTTFDFTAGDSWIVPRGAPYSITNCSRTRALLSFTVFKTPFYQYQFAE